MRWLWLVLLVGCGSSSPSLGAPADGGTEEPEEDRTKPLVDGRYGGVRADRFITQVVSFAPGPCAGFGAGELPDVLFGPPVAGRPEPIRNGGLDVLALGIGGEIVVAFGDNAIVDEPGPDFIVFENAFYADGDPNRAYAEAGEVSVSEDGTTWKTFACTPPGGTCAGMHPTLSSPKNGISAIDPQVAGGDAFDLEAVGLARARFVRIRDLSTDACSGAARAAAAGFDLDTIAIVHAAIP